MARQAKGGHRIWARLDDELLELVKDQARELGYEAPGDYLAALAAEKHERQLPLPQQPKFHPGQLRMAS